MCCATDLELTKKLLKSKDGSFTVYKVLQKIFYSPRSSNLESCLYDHVWHEGWNKSDSKAKLINRSRDIYRGIHVYLDKKRAISGILGSNPERRLVKLTAYKSDLIGVGSKNAVFKKVYLSKAEYKKALA